MVKDGNGVRVAVITGANKGIFLFVSTRGQIIDSG